MRRTSFGVWVSLFVLFGCLVSPAFCLVKEMSVSQIAQEANLAIQGKVVATESKWINDHRGKHIYTFVTIAVSKKVKGSLPANNCTLEVQGGTVGDMTEWVSDTPTFEPGEEVVLFLHTDPQYVIGGFQGKFAVHEGKVAVGDREIPVDRFIQRVQDWLKDPTDALSFDGESGGDDAAQSSALNGTLLPVVTGGGQIPAAELVNMPGSPSQEQSADETVSTLATAETPAAVSQTPELAGDVEGLKTPQPLALAATIWNAWWTQPLDMDGDGYVRESRLNWDPNVVGGSGSLVVYERVYHRPTGAATWSVFTQTAPHTITGSTTADSQSVLVTTMYRNIYDVKIEIYRSGITTPDYTRSDSNDTDLNDYKMEPASQDVPLSAVIRDAWWSNAVDTDGDGYKRSARLNWDPNVTGGSPGPLMVYEKVYSKTASSTSWALLRQTSPHSITGTNTSDAQYLDVTGSAKDLFDFKIEVYRSGATTPGDTRHAGNDTDLNDYKMEPATLDVIPVLSISNAWWSNSVDLDADGYKRLSRLCWSTHATGDVPVVVYEKIYSKLASSTTWSLLKLTAARTMVGPGEADFRCLDVTVTSRNLYDFKIEFYKNGVATAGYVRDPSNDTDLNDCKMERAADDGGPTAVIAYAWWASAYDNDADGYWRSANLVWNPDVMGTGSVTVIEKVYRKSASSSAWTLVKQTSPHVITGTGVSDVQTYAVAYLTRGLYDFKIEIYRSGVASPDYIRDPAIEPALNDKKFESIADDGGPMIYSLSPLKASAGTNTQVTLTGSGFLSTQGTGKVEFFYKSGQAKISAPIVSWSDTQIVCKVPVASIGGYPASTGSGPVTVTTKEAKTSKGSTFKVSFGYGLSKWAGTNPVMSFRVNQNTSDCTGEATAMTAAGTVWNNAASKFTFSYAGATAATAPSQNYINEAMWRNGTDPNVIAMATVWSSGNTIVECDIAFNDLCNWSTSATPASDRMDVQTVATHEMGHWLFLRDLYGNLGDGQYDNGKVMYGFCSNGTSKRALHGDDILGIRWIYGMRTSPSPVEGVNAEAANVPALSLSACEFAPATLRPGDPVTLGAYIENDGVLKSEPVWLECWGMRTGDSLALDGLLVDADLIPALEPGAGYSYTATKPALRMPAGEYDVVFVIRQLGRDDLRQSDNQTVVRGKRLRIVGAK